jgi:hypothetical protein
MDHDPNHLFWGIRRSDVVSVVALGLASYLAVAERQWESVAFALTLVVGAFAGLSPRFQGHIGLKVGSWLQIGATFAKPAQPPRVQSSEPVRVRRKNKHRLPETKERVEQPEQALPSLETELAED